MLYVLQNAKKHYFIRMSAIQAFLGMICMRTCTDLTREGRNEQAIWLRASSSRVEVTYFYIFFFLLIFTYFTCGCLVVLPCVGKTNFFSPFYGLYF